MSDLEIQRAMRNIARWRGDPIAFVREVLKANPDRWQEKVLRAALTRKRICLKASKGPGKSTILSWLAWWFLMTRSYPKVIATSITGDNLKDGLWSEMSKWQNQSPLLQAYFTWGAERITANDHPQTWFMSARTWSHGADSSQQGNTLAGIHADNVLFLVDEAGDIPDAVVAAAEAGLANASEEAGRDAMLVIAGNPTRLSGPLYRACTSEANLWYVVEISGDPDDPDRAPRVSVTWAKEQILKFGRDNPWVLVNVFGKFPPGQSNAVMGVEEVSAAMARTCGELGYDDAPKVLGVDVARFGDDRTVFFPRQGKVAFQPMVYRNLDTQQVADQLMNFINAWKPDAVFIDDGGVGGGVTDACKRLGYGVTPVNFGGASSEPEYANKRMEMWYRTALWIRNGEGCLPNDDELKAELTGPTYDISEKGKMLLESKKDMKKRGKPSPDKADALVLTFASTVAPKLKSHHYRSQNDMGRALRDYDPFTRS